MNPNKKVDWQKSIITGLSVGSWLITMGVLFVIDMASPGRDNMFTHLLGGQEQAEWNYNLLTLGYILLVVSLFSCILGFVLNLMRLRSNKESLKISIVIIGVINLIALVVYTLIFGGQIF